MDLQIHSWTWAFNCTSAGYLQRINNGMSHNAITQAINQPSKAVRNIIHVICKIRCQANIAQHYPCIIYR